MDLGRLLDLIREIPAYRRLLQEIDKGQAATNLSLLRAARPYVVAALATDLQRPILLVVGRPEQVNGIADQLRQWLPSPERVLRLAEPEALPYERIPWAAETVRERLSALSALVRWAEGDEAPPIVVASARALIQRTMPRREFSLSVRTIRIGQRLSLSQVLATWVGLGYEVTSVVQDPGTFSRRGGILDVFPADAPYPVRIELFGDEVDSMRLFEPATQRSTERVDNCVIGPASEALPKFGHLAVEKLAELDISTLHGPAAVEFRSDLEALSEDRAFKGIEFYIPYLYSTPGTLFDYLPAQGLIVLDEPGDLTDTVAELEAEALDLARSLEASGELPRPYATPYVTKDEMQEIVASRAAISLGYEPGVDWSEQESPDEPDEGDGGSVRVLGLERGREDHVEEALLPLHAHFTSGRRYGGQLRRIIEAWTEMQRSGRRIVAVSRQASRLAELWSERSTRAAPLIDLAELPPRRSLTLIQGTLDEGWVLRRADDEPVLDLLSDAEIFGWSKPRPRRVQRKPVHPEVFFADLNPGDYVVHVDFGIGVFQGLTQAKIDDAEREYLRVDYAGEDTVYVPIRHADRLSRYVGAGGRAPVLHRLGTTDWTRVKEIQMFFSASGLVPEATFQRQRSCCCGELWQFECVHRQDWP